MIMSHCSTVPPDQHPPHPTPTTPNTHHTQHPPHPTPNKPNTQQTQHPTNPTPNTHTHHTHHTQHHILTYLPNIFQTKKNAIVLH